MAKAASAVRIRLTAINIDDNPIREVCMAATSGIREFCVTVSVLLSSTVSAFGIEPAAISWNQWRGPSRDGQFHGQRWPEKLDENSLRLKWRVELPPSYSGPIITPNSIIVTGTADQKTEIVFALDRKNGNAAWRKEWTGAVTVPFFAASNGSWIRSTPAFDGETVFVAGMRDVLVAIDEQTGNERWRIDFVEKLTSPVPSFGFVSSPLVDGDAVFVQAGASVIKLNKHSGDIIWRSVRDDGGMMGSAFSSPVIATLCGVRQLVVQTREKLAGVSIDSGEILWEQSVPAFRGMNILTPVITGDTIFTSSYQHKSWLFAVSNSAGHFEVKEVWSEKAQGYMSTPVIVDGHIYLHLQNQRFACLNLATGERSWTSKPFGKYASLVAQGDRILALDQTGRLLLLKANATEFELIDERKVSDEETWAHLAVCDDLVVVRELKGLSVFAWK